MTDTALPAQDKPVAMTGFLTFVFAIGCGLTAANLYYAQPLIGLIAPDIGLSDTLAGFVVTFTQIGYGLALLLIAPLGDKLENRRLIMVTLVAAAIALAGMAFTRHPVPFLAAAFMIGLTSVGAQLLVPFAAHLAPDHRRGRIIGNIMSGLMLGILLARPLSSWLTSLFGWRAVFEIMAVAMLVLAALLGLLLPKRQPNTKLSYGGILHSLFGLLRTNRILQRRTAYHVPLFCAFSLFWTSVPLLLAGPDFGLTQRGIALFALAGAAGAVAAPIAGRWADRGWGRFTTGLAMTLVALAFPMAWIAAEIHSLPLLVLAGITLDFGVQANLVTGQRALFAQAAEARSRLNGIYIASFFFGGAAGSVLASATYTHGGWTVTTATGLVLPLLSLLFFATEFRRGSTA
ncbi:MFS transporter [Ferrovibrio xuzhouensis]|uniref:MFS transporter n=1 Tax=Ferrovibrio xuzhouensis TaxID=1576914 RepID=A0ABV7VIU8_9PROT